MTECQLFQQHWCLLVLLLILAGCSSAPARPACYPLTGKVSYQQRPLEEAQITLHPVSATMSQLPVGVTGADGTFVITTWVSKDGAPAGDYTVTVTWRQLVQSGEEKTRSGGNLLPAIYADPKRTPLKCTIQAGKNPQLKLEIK